MTLPKDHLGPASGERAAPTLERLGADGLEGKWDGWQTRAQDLRSGVVAQNRTR